MNTTATRERPLLFSAPMVRAILDGKKTQTRRAISEPPRQHAGYPEPWAENTGANRWTWYYRDCCVAGKTPLYDSARDCSQFSDCSQGCVGDQIWVKETFRNNGETIIYRADGRGRDPSPIELNTGMVPETDFWRPSIFMPRWASRITLEITRVRAERLHAITEADAIAEGIRGWYSDRSEPTSFMLGPDDKEKPFYDGRTGWHPSATAVDAYRRLWSRINGAASWSANPWVWVIEFKRV